MYEPLIIYYREELIKRSICKQFPVPKGSGNWFVQGHFIRINTLILSLVMEILTSVAGGTVSRYK